MTITQRLSRFLNHRFKLWHVAVAMIGLLVGANFLERFVETRPRVEVKDLIREVKAELVAADQEMLKKGEAALFQLKDFEMEIQFVVRRSGDLHAEVVGVGGGAGASSESVQKLKLHWDALPPKAGSVPATQDAAEKKPDIVIGPEG
jgi:hypothetical protein